MKRLSVFIPSFFLIIVLFMIFFFITGNIEAKAIFPPDPGSNAVFAGTPTISWDGGGDGTNWSDRFNWSGDRLPAASDEVLISVSGTPTINFTSAAGSVSIKSLTCDESLVISGGSLTLTGLSSSETRDSLSVSGGTLTVIGSGTSLTAVGPTTLSNVNLYANSGGVISFPAATIYTNTSTVTVQASGSGSRIDLSHLTTLVGDSYHATNIRALDGAEIDLSGEISGNTNLTASGSNSFFGLSGVTKLSNVDVYADSGGVISFPSTTTYTNTDDITIQASGSGSKIDLSHLVSLVADSYYSTNIKALDGGEIDLSGEISGYTAWMLSGTGSIFDVTGVTKLTSASINISDGRNMIFPSATSLKNVNLNASAGSVISFPAASTYTNTSHITIQASGSGSRIDLSHLVSLVADSYYSTNIKALSGGDIDLSGEISGNTILTASGSGSFFGLSGVTKLSNVDVYTDSGGVISFPSATTYTNTDDITIQASGSGSKIDLSHLVSLVADSYYSTNIKALDGGEVDLAGEISGNSEWTLSGTGSIFDVTGVTKLTKATINISDGRNMTFPSATSLKNVNLNASAGSVISFPAASTYTNTSTVTVQASGSGSRIDLSHLTTLVGDSYHATNIRALDGAEIDLSGEISGNTNLTASGSNSFFGLSGVTKLSNVDVYADSGGVISFPSTTTYTNTDDITIQASGSGSKIDLSHLVSLVADSYYSTNIKALDGGEIDLSGEISGYTAWMLSGTGSIFDVTGVTKLTSASINISDGRNMIFPSATSLKNVNLNASAGSVISFPAASTYTNTSHITIQASGSGSRIDLSHLVSLVADSYYSTNIKALSGGDIDLSGEISGNTNLTASGSNSFFGLSGVTKLSNVDVYADSGGVISFPSTTTYTNTDDITIQASGSGSKIDLSHLVSLVADSYYSTNIKALDGGEVDLAGEISGNSEWTLSGTGSIFDVTGVTKMTRAIINVTTGATLKFPANCNPELANNNSITCDASSQLVNNGTLTLPSTGSTLTITAIDFTNNGVIQTLNGGKIDLNGSVTNKGTGYIKSGPISLISVSGNLTGNTTASDHSDMQGTLLFDGTGSTSTPQLMEVMGQDKGIDSSGFDHNFGVGTLALSNNTCLKLVDTSDNTIESTLEALYVNSLIVPAGNTLDLNGLHLYTRASQVNGNITGGTNTQVSDSGLIDFSSYTPGAISIAGEMDEWTFYGRSGRSVTIVVNTGSSSPAANSPYLSWAQVQLLDIDNNLLASAASTSSGQIINISDTALPGDGNFKVQVRAPSGHTSSTGNYLISIWDVTADVAPLLFNQPAMGRIETAYSVDRWTFTATAGQQVKFDLLNTSGSSILFSLSGPEGWSGFTDITADSDLITLPVSGAYRLTAHASGGQSGGTYTFRLMETTQTDLTAGLIDNETLAGSGQAHLFRVTLTESSPLLVRLDDSSATDHNELYIQHGSPPTRGTYDYRYPDLASADQEILVPMAAPGTWYILVYAYYVPSPSEYTLLATLSSIMLISVTPDHYGAAADAELTLTGSGFDATIAVLLTASGESKYSASSLEIDSFTQATVVFAAGTVPPGTYSVEVTKPGASPAILPDAFRITSGGEAKLETNLVIPESLGRHTAATLYVEYKNTGTLAMPAPLLLLDASQDKAFLTLDHSRVVEGFWTSAIPEGFSSSVQIAASGDTPGVLQPGESRRIPVYYAGLQEPWDFDDDQVNFELGVLTTDNTTPVDWDSLKSQIKPDFVNQEAWDAIWSNFTVQAGNTWGSYLARLDNDAQYLGRLGLRVTDISDLLAFEFLQADGLGPVRVLSSATDASVDSPGLPLFFDPSFSESISSRCATGSLGRGWWHNWEYSLQKADDGTVTINNPGGTRRVFQPDSRNNSYFAQAGDYGILSGLDNGGFTLKESDGLLSTFRADGKLDYLEDTNSNRITCSYSGSLLTTLAHSSGQSLNLAYNIAGRIHTITDSLGRQTTYSYDAANEHLLSVQNYDGRVTAYTYNSNQDAIHNNALTQITLPDGNSRNYTYDTQGHLSTTFRGENQETISFTYDKGRLTATDALGNSSRFFFDHRGLLVKTEDALNNAVQLSFDNSYNLVSLTDPSGRSYDYGYDSKGNLVNSTDPLGYVTGFTYSASFNRLASVIDARSNITKYAYDTKGNLKSILYPDNSQESWSYDLTGNPAGWTNRRGQAIGFTYDNDGHITRKTYADGSHLDYAYDARGNLTSTVDPGGTTRFSYDANDYLTRIDYPAGEWLQFTYDSAGRRSSSLDQTGHKVDYHYDQAGRLASLTGESSQTISVYHYDAAGRLDKTIMGNGIYTTYEYDAASQLLHLVNYKADDTVLSRFDYTYDSRGRRISMDTLDGLWTYEYDDLGQLTRTVFDSTGPDISDQDLAYEYDALGNRVRAIENGVTTEYTTNNMNQYTKVGDTAYTFDADGNLVREQSPEGTTTYTYNGENRLIAVVKGTDTWGYTYDALGNRVASAENGNVTRYVIDPTGLGNVVGEYSNSGDLITHYDHAFGLISRTGAGGDTAYYTFDAIGNTQQLVTASGAIANSYAYTPFGTLLKNDQTVANPFQYVGEFGVMKEGNGLDYMRARYYDSRISRFLNIDTIRFASGDFNNYRYVFNRFLTSIDPSGMITRYDLIKWGIDPDAPAQAPGFKTELEYYQYMESLRSPDIEQKANLQGELGYFFYENTINPIPSWKGVLIGAALVGGAAWLGGIPFGSVLFYEYIAAGVEIGGIFSSFDLFTSLKKLIKLYTDKMSIKISNVAESTDPNQKTGPAGTGAAGYISTEGDFAYRIDFENESTASAPAQQVVITDQINSNLDWNTFRLTEVGFGDHLITIPGNSQHFETTIPVTYNGVDFEVELIAGIDISAGTFTASFYSLDPATGLPPSVNIGFLPPENNTGRGMGHVSYTIQPRPDLAAGAEIRNVALISFDSQPQIATNQIDPHDASKGTDPSKECLNTIADAETPIAADDAYTTSAGIPIVVVIPGVLKNDSDPQGLPLTAIKVSDPVYGTLVWIGNGSFYYTPAETYHASDSFTYKASNGSQESNAATVTINIEKRPTVTAVQSSRSPAYIGQAVTFTATVTSDSGYLTGTVTFKDGSSIMANGVIELTGGQAAYTISTLIAGTHTITAEYSGDGTFASSSGDFSQTVENLTSLTIITETLPDGDAGSAYYMPQALEAMAGVGPYKWSIAKGSTLPASLKLDVSTGIIKGTPKKAGAYTFTVQVTDSAKPRAATATKQFEITIHDAVVLSSLTPLPQGEVDMAFPAWNMTALGGVGPYTWKITKGKLPDGLTLNESSGVISGTPKEFGNFKITLTATETLKGSAGKALTLKVFKKLAITTAPLPAGEAGTTYKPVKLTAAGGTGKYTWSIISSLPPGLSLIKNTLSGTPTSEGTYDFSVQVKDGPGTLVKGFSITVYPALSISTDALPYAIVGNAYSQFLTAAGGKGLYTWSVTGSLPSGLKLNKGTGEIGGTPKTASPKKAPTFTVKVSDGLGTASRKLSIQVQPALSITTRAIASGEVAADYLQTLTAVGGTGVYTWSLANSSVPEKLAFIDGTLRGIPIEAGTFPFTVKVEDGLSAATRDFSLKVYPALTITTDTLAGGTVKAAYKQTLIASGGYGKYSWSIISGALPAGLKLTARTGAITGKPTSIGNYDFTIQLTDSLGISTTKDLSITIYADSSLQNFVSMMQEKTARPVFKDGAQPTKDPLVMKIGSTYFLYYATNHDPNPGLITCFSVHSLTMV